MTCLRLHRNWNSKSTEKNETVCSCLAVLASEPQSIETYKDYYYVRTQIVKGTFLVARFRGENDLKRDDLTMMNLLRESRRTIEQFSKGTERIFLRYRDELEKIINTLTDLAESWSGSFLGYHAELYYGDFERPSLDSRFDVEWGGTRGIPAGWSDRTYDDVVQFVKSKHKKIDLDAIFDQLDVVLSEARGLQRRITADLSFVRDLENFVKETETLDKIGKLDLTVSVDKWVKDVMKGNFVTRDSRAASQGPIVPPHIRFRSMVMHHLSTIICIQEFTNQCMTLLRQMEVRLDVGKETKKTSDSMQNVMLICEKFHGVARQLKERHNQRATLKVDDEYDVQDLTHALLRIFFDDIRPEEWTPSYAGSQSRMDFLLKKEQTVVEAKYDLTDKQIGDQLLKDIARYKNHSDCKTLICFVYDPHGRVRNPRGLERDLDGQSTKELRVMTIIRPA
jgi:hypothetical protein